MIKMLLAVVVLLFLWAPGASAQLMGPEKELLVDWHGANESSRGSHEYLVSAIERAAIVDAEMKKRGETVPNTRPALNKALIQFHQAWTEHWRSYAAFLHTGLENPIPLPVLTPLEWNKTALFHLDRYKLKLDEIGVTLTELRKLYPADLIYQDHLRRSKDIWLAAALTRVARVNAARGLAFEHPWQPLRDGPAPGGGAYTIPTMVFPHGDYRLLQWGNNRAKNYALDALEAQNAIYLKGDDATKLKTAYTQIRLVFNALDLITAVTADVSLTPQQAARDRFCKALFVFKLQTVDAALSFQRWGDAIAELVEQPYRQVFAKLVDAWKHNDHAGWKGLVFPENNRCGGEFQTYLPPRVVPWPGVDYPVERSIPHGWKPFASIDRHTRLVDLE